MKFRLMIVNKVIIIIIIIIIIIVVVNKAFYEVPTHDCKYFKQCLSIMLLVFFILSIWLEAVLQCVCGKFMKMWYPFTNC